MSGEQVTKSLEGGVAELRAQNHESEVLSRPFVLIKGDTWGIGQYLLNQCDKHASGKTKADFHLTPGMDLQLQAASREVF